MAKFKVGDRVRVNEIGKRNWDILENEGVDLGTVIVYNNTGSIGIEFDTNFGGHDCGCGKYGHCWWVTDSEIELVKEEPKPTPTPVVNVNVIVNLYENACWYCRKGGLVDLYFNGSPGICPKCGRIMNLFTPTNMFNNNKREEAPKRENKPLTTEELEALPDGTRVFTLWGGDWTDDRTCWRTKEGKKLNRKGGWCGFNSFMKAYLEEPERPIPEPEDELPF